MSSSERSTGRHSAEAGAPTTVASIPLSDVRQPGTDSIGALVKDATAQVSTLVRAEVELAKAEVTDEVKKGVRGSVFFIVALTVALFSAFFLFITIAEVIAIWLPRSASFGIVFVFMILIAALSAFLGYQKVRKIRKPERTIDAMRDNVKIVKRAS